MRTTIQFSITLPTHMAEQVRAKVEAGEYASESEVIRDGLRALAQRDQVIREWLLRFVAPAYDLLQADPGRALSGATIRERLARRSAESEEFAPGADRPRHA